MATSAFDNENANPRQQQDPRRSMDNPGYNFNSEELRVLRDCNRESFFQRCVPISTILGGGLYYGIKSGFISGHAKYGAAPKVVIGVVVGYFVGKFSYRNKCAEKLMQLPGSPIGEMLRQRKRGGCQESKDTGFGPSISLSPFAGMSPSDTYTDHPPSRSSLDIDISRPTIGELDDTHRPSMDNPNYEEEEMPPIQSQTTSYEELRKRNREEYQQKRIGRPQGEFTAPMSTPRSESTRREPELPKTPTNKYGDSWS